MTEAEFVKNHRGIDQGNDPPKELLEGMYRRIKVRADYCTHSLSVHGMLCTRDPTSPLRCLRTARPMIAGIESESIEAALVYFPLFAVFRGSLIGVYSAGVGDPNG